jgi:hypothetical protein
MKYRVSFYTLSDCHSEKEIEAADRPALMAQLENLMIDLYAPFTIYEIYTGDNKAMKTPQAAPMQGMTPLGITPTPAQQAAEQFREEIRRQFAMIEERLQDIAELTHENRANVINIGADLEAIRAGLTQASQPAPAAGAFSEMMIDNIIMTYDDKGKPAYKATGTPYNKFGVRVWDEVLPTLGIDPASLHPGPNPQSAIRARVLMNEPEEGKTAQPRKVTGKA